MKDYGEWAVAVAAGFCLLFAAQGPADAKPGYGKAEKKSCSFCHVGKTADKVFTDAGEYYRQHHTLTGFAEAGKTEPKAAAEPAAVPVAAPPGKEGTPTAERVAEMESPCGCGCEYCMEKRCPHCAHDPCMGKMPPRREKMQAHLEAMRKAVSDLRENEKTMETLTDPQAFRAAVLDHLKKLDDLEESRLNHMESKMGAMHCGKPGPPHMHSR